MGNLETGAETWKNKWIHWNQYYRKQRRVFVNHIFVIQVKNSS